MTWLWLCAASFAALIAVECAYPIGRERGRDEGALTERLRRRS